MFKARLSMLALASLSTLFACGAAADLLQEDFASDPAGQGWEAYGNTNLFQWDSTNQNLRVTWDSSQTNSYYYHPLGTVLRLTNSFVVEFDIQLNDLQYTGTYPLAVGLFNLTEAMAPNFSRATVDSPDLFEFDYYPDDGLGEPNIAASLADKTVSATNSGDIYFRFDTLPMDPGVTYHVQLEHAAGAPVIIGNVYKNGQLYSSMPRSYPANIVDFQLDTFAVISYSAALDTYGDSILAHGTVGKVLVDAPLPVQQVSGGLNGNAWQVQFTAQTNWLYTLERTTNFQTWTDASPAVAGVSGVLTLTDTNAPAANAFYRVRANRP